MPTITAKLVLRKPLTIKDDHVCTHANYMCGSKDDAKLNDSDHTFVIRENRRIKHRCPLV